MYVSWCLLSAGQGHPCENALCPCESCLSRAGCSMQTMLVVLSRDLGPSPCRISSPPPCRTSTDVRCPVFIAQSPPLFLAEPPPILLAETKESMLRLGAFAVSGPKGVLAYSCGAMESAAAAGKGGDRPGPPGKFAGGSSDGKAMLEAAVSVKPFSDPDVDYDVAVQLRPVMATVDRGSIDAVIGFFRLVCESK